MILSSHLPENLPIFFLDTKTLTFARLNLGTGTPHTLIVEGTEPPTEAIQRRFQSFMDTHVHPGSGKDLSFLTRPGSVTSLDHIILIDQADNTTVAAYSSARKLLLVLNNGICLPPAHKSGKHIIPEHIEKLSKLIQNFISDNSLHYKNEPSFYNIPKTFLSLPPVEIP
jgi:hypothetical protein